MLLERWPTPPLIGPFNSGKNKESLKEDNTFQHRKRIQPLASFLHGVCLFLLTKLSSTLNIFLV